MDAARHDLPEPDALTRPYWEAATRGRLLIRRCGTCGRAHHYPREFCPRCWSEEVTWEEAGGRATLYTWSTVHRNDLPPFAGRTPYLAAVVDLAEGPRMMTELVDCPEDAVRAGMRLEVTFRDGIPVFRPRPDGPHGGGQVPGRPGTGPATTSRGDGVPPGAPR